MRVLITGVTGMAGSHLAEYILSLGGAEVFGTYRWRSKLDNLEDLRAKGQLNMIAEGGNLSDAESIRREIERSARRDALNLVEADLSDPSSMRHLIAGVRPDRIFHLAAQSFVPSSWNAPAQTLQLNAIGQINLFEAIREARIQPRIHVAGSSEEYGLVYPHEIPLRETNPLRPLSPYAVSKVCQEMLAFQYHRSYGFYTVVTRGFNHTGPRRGHVMALSSFALQIAEIESGLRRPVILVGDLTSKRDWTDVRDVVRAYWLALEKGEPGEVYNVGSGRCWQVGEMLEMLLKQATVPIRVEQDPARLRPSDVKILWSDTTKFRSQTGWAPTIPIEQTLRDLLEYWRKRVALRRQTGPSEPVATLAADS